MEHEHSDFYSEHLEFLHNRLLESEVSRNYLSGSNVRLDGKDLTLDDHFQLPFGTLTLIQFVHLFSIFDGSRVHQQLSKNGSEDSPPGLYFTIINNRIIQSPYKNRFGIYLHQEDDSLFIEALHIDHYFINKHKSPPALGAIAFALCAITAHLVGLSKISLVAAGGSGFDSRYIGYKIWPKFGFDADVDASEVEDNPCLVSCRSVQEILAIDAVWWESRGSQRLMSFDLSAGSTSWEKLLAYINGKLI